MVTQEIPKLDPDQPVADQLDTLMLGDGLGPGHVWYMAYPLVKVYIAIDNGKFQ